MALDAMENFKLLVGYLFLFEDYDAMFQKLMIAGASLMSETMLALLPRP